MGDAEERAVALPARVTGECVYCEDTHAQFVVVPRESAILRVRCEGCGAVTEMRQSGEE